MGRAPETKTIWEISGFGSPTLGAKWGVSSGGVNKMCLIFFSSVSVAFMLHCVFVCWLVGWLLDLFVSFFLSLILCL